MNIVFRQCPFQCVGLVRLRFRVANPLAFLAKYSGGFPGFESGLGYRPKVLDGNLLAPVDGFVADHDPDDVAVAPREIDGSFDLSIVAIAVLVDPGPDHDLHAEFRGNRRHQFVAFRRRVQANRSRQGGELFQIGANLLGVGDAVGDGVTRFKRRIGSAWQYAAEVGRRLLLLEQTPKRSVSGGDKQQNGDDGAHRDKPYGVNMAGKRTRPRDPTKSAANQTYICHAIKQLL